MSHFHASSNMKLLFEICMCIDKMHWYDYVFFCTSIYSLFIVLRLLLLNFLDVERLRIISIQCGNWKTDLPESMSVLILLRTYSIWNGKRYTSWKTNVARSNEPLVNLFENTKLRCVYAIDVYIGFVWKRVSYIGYEVV